MDRAPSATIADLASTSTPASEFPLLPIFSGWGGFQRSLVKVIAPLTPEQLALPVASHHWSIGMAIQHIVSNRSWWFHVWLGQGEPDTVAYTNWDGEGQPVRTPAELIAGLEATWALIEGGLSRWTIADLTDLIAPPPSLSAAERETFRAFSRHEIIWHVHAHDYHHGGELAAGMGAYHLPTLSGWGS